MLVHGMSMSVMDDKRMNIKMHLRLKDNILLKRVTRNRNWRTKQRL